MNRQSVVSLACFFAAAVSYAVFTQSSYVDSEGMLHEKFFLLPLSMLLTVAGLVAGGSVLWKKWAERQSERSSKNFPEATN